jgi:hypothetical protein
MEHGPAYIKTQAMKDAEIRLKQAATFTALNIKNPVFQKLLGKGTAAVLVRFEWPGVLSVIDPDTGDLLAVSEPGKPASLCPDFVPPVPAMRHASAILRGMR